MVDLCEVNCDFGREIEFRKTGSLSKFVKIALADLAEGGYRSSDEAWILVSRIAPESSQVAGVFTRNYREK